MKAHSYRFLLLALQILLLSPSALTAAVTRTWDGSASGNWSNGANWVGGVAPAPGDSLVFPVNATRYVTTNNFPEYTFFAGIAIHGSNYFFRGSSLQLQDDLRALAASGPVTFDLGLRVVSPNPVTQFESRYGSVLRFNGNIHIAAADHPLQFMRGVIRVAGAITGPGRVEAIDTDLYFDGSAANTFGGSLKLNIGNLYLNKTSADAAIPVTCVVERGIGTAGWVRWLRDEQVAQTATFHHLFLDLNNQSETINDFHTSCVLSNGTLSLNYNIVGSSTGLFGNGNGRLYLNGGFHQLIATNGPFATVPYEITGPGDLWMVTPGFMILQRSNSFTGELLVYDGIVGVSDSQGLGATNGGTVVFEGGTLMLRNGARVVGEPLTLSGGGFFDPEAVDYLPDGYAALHATSSSNAWLGPITLDGLASIGAQGPGLDWSRTNSVLLINGAISGDGFLIKEGMGTVILGGSDDNTFSGSTFVWSGRLKLDKNGATAIPQSLWIQSPDDNEISRVEYVRGAQIPDSSSVSVRAGAVLAMHNQSDIIRNLTLYNGTLDTGTGALIITETLHGIDELDHPGNSRVFGNGRLLFSPAAHDIFLNPDPANDFALEITCEVGGSGALNIKGEGSLFLGHSNSFSGLLTMSADTLGIADPFALGGTARGTIVHSNSTVALYAVNVPVEPLTLRGGASLVSAVNFPAEWGGPISLPDEGASAFARGSSETPGDELNLRGVISGPGDLEIDGGQVMFSGPESNTQSGDVHVLGATLLLAKANANAIARKLYLGDFVSNVGGTLRLLHPDQIADDAGLYLGSGGFWNLGGFDETIGGLGGREETAIELGSGTLTVAKQQGAHNGLLGYAGVISGTGGFTKRGNGHMSLSGDNTYSGPTLVEGGSLYVWGAQPQSHVDVLPGATFYCHGTVGHVHAASSATVSPGFFSEVPAMTTSNLTLEAGSVLDVNLYGHASNQFVRVRGNVSLDGGVLNLDFRYIPSPGDTYKLIDNDGGEMVNGTFAGIPGGLFTAPNGMLMEMTYGNDVTLRVLSPGQSALPAGIGITVTGGNGNGAIDPNECNQLRVTIVNTGTNDLPPFKTMLVTDMPEVTITQPASDYPAIPVNGSAVNVTPFQISTTDKLECGTNIPCRLLILTTNGSAFALELPLPTGLPATPVRYDAAPNLPVLDGILTESAIHVPALGNHLASVEVSVLIEHPRSSDLRLSLVAPDGTVVLLAEDLGNGVNYGTSCAPNARTHFADNAANPITGASAPFVGRFRPQTYLAAFRGMPGATVAGNWKLRVNDHVHFNTGFLRCWSLTLAPAVCTDGGGVCEPCPGPIVDSVPPDAPLANGRVDVYALPSNCFSNSVCPGVKEGPTPYRAHAFTNLSSQPTCVSVVFTPQCEVDPQYNFNVVAYLGGFNPANVCENFLASGNTPVYPNVPRKFSIQVPGHSAFEIVVTAANNPACTKYRLEVLSPDLCPVSLNIAAINANTMRLDWPSHAGGYELQRTSTLVPMDCCNVTNAPVITNGRFTVTNEVVDPNGFYRLRKP